MSICRTAESVLTVEKGKRIKSPPKAAGTTEFIEWCSDDTLDTPFDFTETIETDLTLYAKFQPES